MFLAGPKALGLLMENHSVPYNRISLYQAS